MLKVQPESLVAMMPAENAIAMGGVAGAHEQMLKMKERMGSVVKVLAEKMTRREGKPQFWFEADYTDFTDEPVVMRFVFTEDGKLVGLGINPKSAAKFDS